MSATLKQLRTVAKHYSATVQNDRGSFIHECRVEAPKGFKWCDGVHELVAATHTPWAPDYDDLIDRIKLGIEKCTDPLCEWCHPEE